MINLLLFLLILGINQSQAVDCQLMESSHTINSLFGPLHIILEKDQFKIEEIFFFENSQQKDYLLLNYIFFGITEKCTIIPTLPIVSKKSTTPHGNSSGLGDLTFQFNYLLYQQRQSDCQYRLVPTIGVGFPTTTISQNTLFSLPAFNGFVGLMQDIITPSWFCSTDLWFISVGKKDERKIGNLILYAWALGKTYCYHDHFLTFLLEYFGLYTHADHINNRIDLTTGGHAAYIGPTIRYFYKDFYIHAGVLATISYNFRAQIKPSTVLTGLALAYYF